MLLPTNCWGGALHNDTNNGCEGDYGQYQTDKMNSTKQIKPLYTSCHYQQNRKNHALAGHQALPSAVLQWVMEEGVESQPQRRLEKKHDYVRSLRGSYELIILLFQRWTQAFKNMVHYSHVPGNVPGIKPGKANDKCIYSFLAQNYAFKKDKTLYM